MAEDTPKQEAPVPDESPKPPEEKPDFKPPEGFGPDFVNKAAGDDQKKREK